MAPAPARLRAPSRSRPRPAALRGRPSPILSLPFSHANWAQRRLAVLSCSSHLLVCLSLSVPPRFPLQNLHQLKQIQTLKQMNEQLQAENRALARVVARLSRAAEASESQEL